ncbi:uncharacterized protein LOC132706768 isoform X1 [Cylas formicarius]|uniref:uncharacterized protein LOC132706768 isoform X1 n=1 Tax=Cylas formicarius TaxID=197179 RepID=UPI002958BD26|nr:uncharacterized protein LOC132706768 isoform X1 [Cylas formicarius]
MRQLFTSKAVLQKGGSKYKKMVHCRMSCSTMPKRMITTKNWIARNDSSNVDAILHPPSLPTAPLLKQDETTKGNVTRKPMLSQNSCYCTHVDEAAKPTLLSKPKECTSKEEPEDLRIYQSSSCVCVLEPRQLEILKDARKEHDLSPTEHRQKYEEFRQAQEDAYALSLAEDKKREEKRLESTESAEPTTLLGTQNYGTRSSTVDILTSDVDPDNIEAIQEFRREHYFETHDIGQLWDVGQHTCMHEFVVGHGTHLDPVNRDWLGNSRCALCHKTIGTTVGPSVFGGGRKRTLLKNLSKSSEYGLEPRVIQSVPPGSKIKLTIKGVGGEVTRPAPVLEFCNSLALRHQKMR